MTSFIIRDIRIFTGEKTIPEGFIHVEEGKIKAIGASSDAPESSSSIKSYSKPGHTLLPGLIDCHIHADNANPGALRQSLRFGVTTVCDMHNEIANVHKLQKQTQELDTASYKTAGQAATVDGGWPAPIILAHNPDMRAEIATWPKLTNRENVIEYLEWNKQVQPDYIKLMHESGSTMGMQLPQPTIELQKIIVEEARKRGYLTVAHAVSLKDTLAVLESGVDGLTHTFLDQPITQEVVDAYKRNNAWLNPTLITLGSGTGEGKELQHQFAHDPRVQGLLDDGEASKLCKCLGISAGRGKVEYAYESVRVLRNAGIDIVCGSDATGAALGTAFGLSLHQELSLFVHEVGMTPEEAIQSATSVIARRFGYSDRGVLAEGLNADLFLVEGNPLEDINATLNIRGVWRDGKPCSAHTSKLES